MRLSTTLFLLLLIMTGCQFSKSVKKDLISGLLTTGDNLTCEDVSLTVDGTKISNTAFVYGEEFKVNFNDIRGFTEENGYVFPGMNLFVLDNTGDTLMKTQDLYSEYLNGLKISPLLLTAALTVAAPMKSKGNYSLHVDIRDKKGKGKFTAKLDFTVKTNEQIAVEAVNVKYDEIYLFSKEKNKVLTGNKVSFNEKTYIIFEGLSGFLEDKGKVFPGLSLKATDKDGTVILDYDDLFSDYSENGMAVSDFSDQILTNFIIKGTEFRNPLHCEVIISDKKSTASIKTTFDLIVQ